MEPNWILEATLKSISKPQRVLDVRNREFTNLSHSYISRFVRETFRIQTQVELVSTIEEGSGHYEKLKDLART